MCNVEARNKTSLIPHRCHINRTQRERDTIDRRPLDIDIITRMRPVLCVCAPLCVNIRSSFIDLFMHCVETFEMDPSFTRMLSATRTMANFSRLKIGSNVKMLSTVGIDVVQKSLEKLRTGVDDRFWYRIWCAMEFPPCRNRSKLR